MQPVDHRTKGRIRPTPATQALFDNVDRLRAEKATHATLSTEWLRLGAEVCRLTEAIRKMTTEAGR